MTPPRPTAPTAAEQAFSHAVYDVLATIAHGDPPATSCLDDINRLTELLLAAARAEAVAPVLDVLRQLVEAQPGCTAVVDQHLGARCGKPATRAWGRGGPRWCDTHGASSEAPGAAPEYPRAAPLRAALALLAADQSGEKAGKP